MNGSNSIPDKTLATLVQQHLVHDTASVSSSNSSQNNSPSVLPETASPPTDAEIPVPYHLPGAAITHDVYTHANSLVMAAQSLSRSRSLSNLKQKPSKLIHDDEAIGSASNSSNGSDNDSVDEFENLDKPGGFRRFHIQQQHRLAAENTAIDSNSAFQELFRPDSRCSVDTQAASYYTTGLNKIDTAGGTSNTNYQHQQPVTRHFLEYLAITSVINQFAGEDLSDSEGDSLEEDEENMSEQTALLINKRHKPKRRHSERRQKAEHKADIKKTVFLLFKAFIGSGILFLPKAFSNGGLVFSIFTMWFMGGISLYCFLLLLDCKQHLTGSYGDMGGQLYGPWMRSMVLFSVAISQVYIKKKKKKKKSNYKS
jgi:proton-coupled amino acid transporter